MALHVNNVTSKLVLRFLHSNSPHILYFILYFEDLLIKIPALTLDIQGTFLLQGKFHENWARKPNLGSSDLKVSLLTPDHRSSRRFLHTSYFSKQFYFAQLHHPIGLLLVFTFRRSTRSTRATYWESLLYNEKVKQQNLTASCLPLISNRMATEIIKLRENTRPSTDICFLLNIASYCEIPTSPCIKSLWLYLNIVHINTSVCRIP